jgi:16S rRNA processing protein RimM
MSRICVGVVSGAHGVRGLVRVRSFTEEPSDFVAYGPVFGEGRPQPFAISIVGRSRRHLIVRIDGLDDREAADRLSGTGLYVERSALPAPADDEYYYADLIGLRAALSLTGDDEAFGTVVAVHRFGAGDILEIEDGDRQRHLVPFTRDAVPVVDLAGRRLVVEALPGLLAPADEDAGAEVAGVR